MTRISRRRVLQTALVGGAASSCAPPKRILAPYSASAGAAGGTFAHGVASGDPGHDSVVIWTRLTVDTSEPLTVVWEIAADEAFTDMRGKGEALASPAADWTVKAVVGELSPGAVYFYRFRAGDAVSPVGRTRTLPAGAVERARFAVVSCANFQFGLFNVYHLIAQQDDIDAVLHLGDYIYEYGPDGYGGATAARLGRPHDPPHEAITLDDYRRRHAQYKSEASLQAAHAAHPFIAVWDDHETSNNSWKGGAENHDSLTEGEWEARRRAALQAYYEWMPVREPAPGRAREALFRTFSYGDLLTLTALETRLMARARQFEYQEVVPTLETPADVEKFRNEILWDESREMLGAEQSAFIGETLRASVAAGQPWQLIANQVIMAEVIAPDLNPRVTEEDVIELEREWPPARAFIKSSALGLPTNFDAWDGYPAARERFYNSVKEAGADGLIVVTGDTHTWWANDLTSRDGGHVGVELGVHSITSDSPYRKSFLGGKGAEYALLTNKENKSVRYLSGEDHGYIDLEIRRDGADARYVAVDTIEQEAYNAFEKVSFSIRKGRGGARFDGITGVSFKEKFLF
jgi:phosphodiesterase/alkaline phosphatase D-like protein